MADERQPSELVRSAWRLVTEARVLKGMADEAGVTLSDSDARAAVFVAALEWQLATLTDQVGVLNGHARDMEWQMAGMQT